MTLRLAVFDCDGTLVDGQAAICETMEQAFATAGLPQPDRHAVRRMVGLSLPYALRELAPDASEDQRARALEAYKQGYRALRLSGALHEPLYEGMADLVARLAGAGWLLGVATGKSDRGLNACLESHGIRQHFVTLQTADRHPSKPHPAMLEAALYEAGVGPAQAVMIGDTSFDMEMARAAHVRAIGVDWGYHQPHELIDAGASAVAGTMTQLEEMIVGSR
ncbi:MAG: HAD-IA family hydrolase [Erythrobacter sp.]|jgi:phosphoglycolate phosphatase